MIFENWYTQDKKNYYCGNCKKPKPDKDLVNDICPNCGVIMIGYEEEPQKVVEEKHAHLFKCMEDNCPYSCIRTAEEMPALFDKNATCPLKEFRGGHGARFAEFEITSTSESVTEKCHSAPKDKAKPAKKDQRDYLMDLLKQIEEELFC